MDNTALKDIKERLLEKGNRHRDVALKEIDAHARGYLLGVFDTLEMVEAAEQQAQPAPEPRTNLDVIRAMSAEELVEWARATYNGEEECCEYCEFNNIKSCPVNRGTLRCKTNLAKWLNSPAKEGSENG